MTLFRMQRNLLSFQIVNQLFCAVYRDLVAYQLHQPTITQKTFINLDALFAHHVSLSLPYPASLLLNYDAERIILFLRICWGWYPQPAGLGNQSGFQILNRGS